MDPEKLKKMLAFIRQGAHAWVAAEAVGLSSEEFLKVVRSMDPVLAPIQDAIREAVAQARVLAEVEVKKKKPLEWLTKGPGKSEPGRPGWSERVEHTGADGGAVRVTAPPEGPDLTKLSKDELAVYEALLAKLAGS